MNSEWMVLPLFIGASGAITISIIGSLMYYLLTHRKSQFKQESFLKTLSLHKQEHKTTERIDEQNPYELLGVNKGATKPEIIKAYKRKLKQYHPDIVAHKGEEYRLIAKHKTILLHKAKEILLRNINKAAQSP